MLWFIVSFGLVAALTLFTATVPGAGTSSDSDTVGAKPRPLPAWDRLVYLGTWGTLLVLGGTGLFAILGGGFGSLGGWALFFHFGAAPAFIIALLLLVFTWGERCRFGMPTDQACGRFDARIAVLFWVATALGFVAIAAIMASMLPLFSSEAQHTLYFVHRFSALALIVVMILHGLAMFRARRKA